MGLNAGLRVSLGHRLPRALLDNAKQAVADLSTGWLPPGIPGKYSIQLAADVGVVAVLNSAFRMSSSGFLREFGPKNVNYKTSLCILPWRQITASSR